MIVFVGKEKDPVAFRRTIEPPDFPFAIAELLNVPAVRREEVQMVPSLFFARRNKVFAVRHPPGGIEASFNPGVVLFLKDGADVPAVDRSEENLPRLSVRAEPFDQE